MAIEENDAEPDPVVTRPRRRWVLPLSLAAVLLLLFASIFLRQNKTSSEVVKEAELKETPIRLTDDPGDDSHPRWTSDGHIRFFRADANDQTASFIMNADGTGQSRVQDFTNLRTAADTLSAKVVLSDPKRDLTFASYAPDGEQIVYQGALEDGTGEPQRQVCSLRIPIRTVR